jgi:hypothetical protein
VIKKLLHAEGAAVLGAAIYLYFWQFDGPWQLYVPLLLSPDLGMVGYLRNTRLGSVTYNATHSYLLGIVLVTVGVGTGNDLPVQLGLIAASHVGMDRMLGYGLKYAGKFKDTHMQRV